jgi:ParB-like chromosome segregation protein Spo0J
MKVHPVAELFPMMSEEELADLAADIKANGLIHPIIVDTINGEEMLIDGRNRARAYEMAGKEPRYEGLNGHDAVAFILSNNIARRQMTKGQMAITLARLRLLEPNNSTQQEMATVHGVHRSALAQAETIVRYAGELADQVLTRTTTFEAAYVTAREMKAEAESNGEKIARLRAEAPDLADLSDMTLDEAIDKLDQRKAEAARLKTIEDAPDLVRLVQEARLTVDEALAAYEKRNSERYNLQKSATDFLAQVVALIGVGERSPKEMAGRIMEDFNPTMWPQEQIDDLNARTFKACADMLAECACIFKAQK